MTFPSITAFGQEFTPVRKPPALLIAELGRASSNASVESIGTLAEFLAVTLGEDEYRRFRKAAYAADPEDNEAEMKILFDAMANVMEATTSTPTK